MNKPVVLVVYDYFYPGYKAGGPIQSLTNLVVALEHTFSFQIFTSAYDLNSSDAYIAEQDKWQSITLPGSKAIHHVWYCSKAQPDLKTLQKIMQQLKPDVIYLNGIFSFRFFILPLLAFRRVHHAQLVVCPRGMLQKGALAVKPLKKKIFIATLNLSGLLGKAKWHATNEDEAVDIQHAFPKHKGIVIAPNIPKKPLEAVAFPAKKTGELRLIYLSLIAEKKNLLLLLNVLRQCEANVTLDIYGPVLDTQYWPQCESLINKMPQKVKYMGDVKPADVQLTIAKYHALILLTKGENFGHALYESLSTGRPVITSIFTPWNALQEANAGYNVSIDNANEACEVIKILSSFSQNELEVLCTGAYHVAKNYFESLHPKNTYKHLFL